ncbi:MAG TPA: hypothetical protein VJ945_05835 [Flavobacteriaceae bacterium]|nr:hypothetical protein [Flavobacteriaceae bacterium]
MKNMLKYRFVFLALVGVFLCSGSNSVYAQNAKKHSVRMKAYYTKIMDSVSFFKVTAFSRIDKENVDISNIELTFYNELDGEKIKLGTATTDMHGECKFVLKNLNEIKPDSTNTYNIDILFKGNDTYKKASKSVSFKDASITAKIITKDSTNYVSATLKDIATDSVLSDRLLNVQVQRLFRSLPIGKEFNSTDENGTVVATIPDGIPGVNRNLTFEVVLKDSDDYGTVMALVNAPLGTPIKDESTFDERTMWSPRDKTPLFLLIFPNLLTFGIWGIIIYLIINLFKISKSKI